MEQAASQVLTPTLAVPPQETVVLAGPDPAALALATSQATFEQAPVVLLAGVDDVTGQARAASLAVTLGTPMLLVAAGTPAGTAQGTSEAQDALTEELERLGTTTALAFGEAGSWDAGDGDLRVLAAPADVTALGELTGLQLPAPREVPAEDLTSEVARITREDATVLDVQPPAPTESASPAPSTSEPSPGSTSTTTDASAAPQAPDPVAVEDFPALTPAPTLDSLLVLTTGAPGDVAATATARAAGARVLVLPGGDPRGDSDVIDAIASDPPASVLALGEAFGSAELVQGRIDVAATGVELPGGGQVLFPGRVMVALYGNPSTSALGVLGEQPLPEAIERAQQVAAEYEPLVDVPVVPAFEIIATIASSEPGGDGDYSNESSVEDLRPWVDAAREAGVYVVLDLQPGRTDFLTQAQIYEELLVEPHVGLALDPEWRLEPDEVHLQQIGSVAAEEVNSVIDWLADLTAENQLPQKLLILHQFRLSMIEGRDQVDTSRDEVAVLVHGDGNGTPDLKFATWNALTSSLPPGMWLGWKNFYDEDSPTFTPQETMAVEPPPLFVSYQ